jgi:hypothetical protein
LQRAGEGDKIGVFRINLARERKIDAYQRNGKNERNKNRTK